MIRTRHDTYSPEAKLAMAAKLSQRGQLDIDRVARQDPELGQALREVDAGNGAIDEPEEFLEVASWEPDRFVRAIELAGQEEILPQALRDFLAKRVDWVVRDPNGDYRNDLGAQPKALYPGSFNPLHEGHLKLHRVAQDQLGTVVHFEISSNPSKAPLTTLDYLMRGEQFDDGPVLFNSFSLFGEKANQFPGTTFVIGGDTAQSLFNEEIYPPEYPLESAFADLEARGSSFLVAAREKDGKLLKVDTLDIPPSGQRFVDMMTQIPTDRFLVEMSSTSIRQRS